MTNEQTKNIIIICAVVALIGLITFVILKLTGVINKAEKKKAEKEATEQFLKEVTITNLRISETTAKQLAEKLYTAMKGWGTDEKAIYEVFSQVSTRDDVLYIFAQFGLKDGRNLTQWLTSELNAKERTKVNAILTEKNINYQI
jgi:predicted PurR-regulated permease PerM